MKIKDNEILIYNTDDGKVQLEIKLDHEGQTIWLTQNQIAELFDVSLKTVNEHLQNIYGEGELLENATIRNFRIVRQEGSRNVERELSHYNLRAILAVGYRVRSERGTQFRKWASESLNEYLVKGFVMNDKRLKNPGGWDYFDELIERIKDIRASEKRFYQKVRDLIKETSTDYDKDAPQTREFFATIQNRLLFAQTGKTAAELIIERADGSKPNMGLTTFDGEVVRKKDIDIAKNYLTEEEVKELNSLVNMFLDFADDRARQRKAITLAEWVEQTEQFLKFYNRDVLQNAGKKSQHQMLEHAQKQYELFEKNRKEAQDALSEEEHLQELESTLKEIEQKAGKKHGKK
ncbi:virulence RhuM family protein [Pseudobdellovibrio exovorus]|uniref:Uncharacterized protein n=1 Tax=Pseudobdellovibrio exovorus JSS TaxID=1184267 RepID=M4V8V3_9BACT|nr:virulence RhuM family protein [Pseudobdellovibrio exovorus]AGH94446.1 hypothetical protein A11Q_226 [Pseudobdellovibrio exovorus JSS]